MFARNIQTLLLLIFCCSALAQKSNVFAQVVESPSDYSVLESAPTNDVEASVVELPPVENSVLKAPPQINESSVLQGEVQSHNSAPTLASAMLSVHNQMRVSFGRSPQHLSPQLTQIAQQHASRMAATGRLIHIELGGNVVRENIAMGQNDVEAVFGLWRSKAGHFRNLMGDEPSVGFGYAIGNNGAPYWVAIFGSENSANQIAPVVYEAPVSRATPGQTLIRGLIPAPLKQFSSGGILRRTGSRFSR